MKEILVEEPVPGTPQDKLRIGTSSWDGESLALKYCWPDSRGRVARGGELPLNVTPQAIKLMIRSGYMDAATVLHAVADALSIDGSPT
jgi:hypothetical protein